MHQNRSPKEFSFQTKRMLLTPSLNLLALRKQNSSLLQDEIFPAFFSKALDFSMTAVTLIKEIEEAAW